MAVSAEDLTRDQISQAEQQLRRICDSSTFARSPQLRRFLTYIVERTLAGHARELSQYSLAMDFFERSEEFDPAIDAVVRVEAGRLRTKLRDYYFGEGTADTIRLELAKGGYSASFSFLESTEPREVDGADLQMQTARVERPCVPVRRSPNGRPTVAVLPFDDMSADPDQTYFADGLCEDLITSLSNVKGMSVIARHSSFAFRDVEEDITRISTDLGASYVVEGSVRKAGERLRINAQLIDGESGLHVWADRYDADLNDIFDIQDKVCASITEALSLKLSGSKRPPTENLTAYDYVLLGMNEARSYSQEASVRARYCFKTAIELDPGYAAAYSRLAFNSIFQWIADWTDDFEASVTAGSKLADKAVSIDGTQSLSHAALSWSLLWRGEQDQAIAIARRGLELNPNDVDVQERLSLALSFSGRPEDALKTLQEAKRLNPMEGYHFPVGCAHFMAEDYKHAIAAFEACLKKNARFLPALLYLGASIGLSGDGPDRDVLSEIRQVSPNYAIEDERYLVMRSEATRDKFTNGLRRIGLG